MVTSPIDCSIGIDVGTGSARAGVFDASGKMLGQGSHPIKMWKPQADFVEQSSDDIWGASAAAVRQAVREADIDTTNLRGIGFDATVTIRTHTLPVIRGFLMYLTAVLQTIAINHEAPLMKIKTDEETWEENNLMFVVCNGPREGGGFLGEVGVADGAFRRGEVLQRVAQRSDVRLERRPLEGPETTAKRGDLGDHLVDDLCGGGRVGVQGRRRQTGRT